VHDIGLEQLGLGTKETPAQTIGCRKAEGGKPDTGVPVTFHGHVVGPADDVLYHAMLRQGGYCVLAIGFRASGRGSGDDVKDPHGRKSVSSSFLKKRTKKLLSIAGITELAPLDGMLAAIGKSFLLLFFKKEELLSFAYGKLASPASRSKSAVTARAAHQLSVVSSKLEALTATAAANDAQPNGYRRGGIFSIRRNTSSTNASPTATPTAPVSSQAWSH
jgi:hypothetical protein